jgi:hypothetical protein
VSGALITGTTVSATTGRFSTCSGDTGLFDSTVSALTVSCSNLSTIFISASTLGLIDISVTGYYRGVAKTVPASTITGTLGNYFTKTVTSGTTFTVTGVPSSGNVYGFTLEVTHTSGTITWFSGVEWPNSTAPTLTTGKTHLFMFVTDDGGARWRGSSLINYTN